MRSSRTSGCNRTSTSAQSRARWLRDKCGGGLRNSLHKNDVAERISSRCSGVEAELSEATDTLKLRLWTCPEGLCIGEVARDRVVEDGEVGRGDDDVVERHWVSIDIEPRLGLSVDDLRELSADDLRELSSNGLVTDSIDGRRALIENRLLVAGGVGGRCAVEIEARP